MRYTNARLGYNNAKAATADAALFPICIEFSGNIETTVREYVFEIGRSALDYMEVPAQEYITEISTRNYCRELLAKELEAIELHKKAIYFSVVDFPVGQFNKASARIFSAIKKLNFEKIIINDTNRCGADVWEKYGFSGGYLDSARVKLL